MGIEAGNPEFTERIRRQVDALAKRTTYHTLDLGGGRATPGLIPIEALRKRLDAFPIPKELAGKRVLDVGAASGWNSFEVERRGADVMAVDCVEYEELPEAKQVLGSRAEYRILDVDELTPDAVGMFDYVLFFGVLYHLRHPLLGLERICALTREAAFVESFVTDHGDERVIEFYPVDELGGQIDNWYGPSVPALEAMCRSAGFARVQLEYVDDRRAGITCYRKWEPPLQKPAEPAPWLCSAVNNRTQTPEFHPLKDEYVCLYFRAGGSVSREYLRPEVDGFGVPALTVSPIREGEWQANLKLPPGLAPGEHEVRLRTDASPFSESFPITVVGAGWVAEPAARVFADAESAPHDSPEWVAVENCSDRTAVFRGYKNEHLCCRFLTAEKGLRKDHVSVELDGTPQAVLVLSRLGENEWQTNSRLPAGLRAGRHSVRLRTANSRYTEEREIEYRPD